MEMGSGEPVGVGACLGAEAVGERVRSSCFYPFRVHYIEAASVALWPFAQSLRCDFSSSFPIK